MKPVKSGASDGLKAVAGLGLGVVLALAFSRAAKASEGVVRTPDTFLQPVGASDLRFGVRHPLGILPGVGDTVRVLFEVFRMPSNMALDASPLGLRFLSEGVILTAPQEGEAPVWNYEHRRVVNGGDFGVADPFLEGEEVTYLLTAGDIFSVGAS